jgi:hypothetical protein
MKFLISFLITISFYSSYAQKGTVTVIKDPLIDTLIAKRMELNKPRATVTNPASKAIFNGMGYRVQVFYGGDRREAFREQSKFRAIYPKTNTYITYKEPNYYLRVGDFRTRMDAERFLNELRPDFSTLFIFREKINAPDLE